MFFRGGVQTSLIAEAESFSDEMQYDDYLYYEQIDDDDNGSYDYIKITDCEEAATEIVIPGEIDGLPVKEIGNNAFSFCHSLISIDIPSSVTRMGNNAWNTSAFASCESLESINVSEENENYVSIDGVLFTKDTVDFCLVQYPSGKKNSEYAVPEGVRFISSYAICNCENLVSIYIPDSLEFIGLSYDLDGNFQGCSNLTDINVSEANKSFSSIDGILFSKYETELEVICYPSGRDDKSYSIPDGVISIGSGAFFSCTSLTSVDIPDSVTSIGTHAFDCCENLKSIDIPDRVTSIRDWTFCSCYNLSHIKLPKGLESIGKAAFDACVKLTDIELPEGLEFIESYAFYMCASLTDINIPENVIEIGEYAFGDCVNLLSIKIPNSITEINLGTFNGCKSLSLAEIPDGVTDIDDSAFYCYGRDSLIICGSEESYAKTYAETYAEDNNITFVPISQKPEIKTYESLKYIQEDSDKDGKSDCIKIVYCDKSATEVNIPDNIDGLPVTSIRSFAFAGKLLNVGFGGSDDGVEKDISNITNVSIPDSVTYIGYGAFGGTPMLYDQTTSVKYADDWAVYCGEYNTKSGAAKIKEGTRGIANEAFDICYHLDAIYIPDSVVFIGDNVFESKKEDFTILGKEGSAAQTYAEKHNFKFSTPNLGLGKYEYQLDYNGEIKLYFFPDESGTYHFESTCAKYHELHVNGGNRDVISSDSTRMHSTIKCNADEVYVITLEPYDPGSDGWKEEYRWSEGDTENGSLWIYKEVTEEKQFSDLEEFTVSANTKTNINFTLDELTTVMIDKCDMGYYNLYDSDGVSYLLSPLYYAFPLKSGTYTLKLDAVEKDTIIKIKSIDDKSDLLFRGIDEDEDGIYDSLEIFDCNESIEELIIPNEFNGLPVKYMDGNAFYECNSLRSIEISENITSIGRYGFSQVPNLENISVSENNSQFSSVDGILFNKGKTELISYPMGKTDTQYSIPDSVTKISNYAFCNAENLKNIKISDNVRTIGSQAFRYCDGLESVNIPKGVVSIDNMAFDYCQNLKNITILNPNCEIAYKAISNKFNKEGISEFSGTICGYKNSTAQEYAEDYGYKFRLIGDEPNGDANGDGKVNVRDAAEIARKIAQGKKDELPESADYNKDGKVNVRDAAAIARDLARGII